MLADIERFIQLLPGTYESNRPITITPIDEFHLKCNCTNGSIVNGAREPLLCSFSLSSPPGHQLYKKPRTKLSKKVKKLFLSHLTFHQEDDDHIPVKFKNE